MTEHFSREFHADLSIRADGEGRTISGIIVPFEKRARVSDGGPAYDEMFRQGAFARTINAGVAQRVKLLSQHNAFEPLGRATSLREDSSGLFGEFYVSRTTSGDNALELVRDGVTDSFSVGFTPVKAVKEGTTTVRTEVKIREASIVTFPAYEDARILAVRAADLGDDEIAELAARLLPHFSATHLGDPAAPELGTDDDPLNEHSARNLTQQFLSLRALARKKGVIA